MNWDNGIEVSGDGGKVLVTLGELHSILLENLTRDDLEEFAGEMIKFAVMEPVHLGEEL
ncbi:hypothetical protein MUO65_02185 [bacterium]|nr:hypothetical protein [bacterium]